MKIFARMLLMRPGLKFLGIEQKVGSRLVWNFPGGKVETGECPRTAAMREVVEEVGFLCRPRFVRLVCAKQFVFGDVIWKGHFFVYLGPTFPIEIKESDKIARFRWLNGEDARALDAYHNVFTDIYDIALRKFRVSEDPWTKEKCVELSRSSKPLNRDVLSMFSG